MEIFKLADLNASRADVSAWLKKEDQAGRIICDDLTLATFLNGLIVKNRGKRDEKVTNEERLTNNMIWTKLKIALKLQSDDVLNILMLAEFRLGKSELSAFFRKPKHKHYRVCQDQVLRNFLHGLQIKYRDQEST